MGTKPAKQPTAPSQPQPASCDRLATFGAWKAQLDQASASGDVYTAHAYRTAIAGICTEMARVQRVFGHKTPQAHQPEPAASYQALRRLAADSGTTRKQQQRRKALATNLTRIDSLIQQKDFELARRSHQLAAYRAPAPPSRGQASVVRPEVLRVWLIDQADMALACHVRASGKDDVAAQRAWCEHLYFKQLFDKRAQQGDPWAMSRAIRTVLVASHSRAWRPVLHLAHCHLVQVMTDPDLKPSNTTAEAPISSRNLPCVEPDVNSRRRRLCEPASGGALLSESQANELDFLVRLADSQDDLGPAAGKVALQCRCLLATLSGAEPEAPEFAALPTAVKKKMLESILAQLACAGYL